MLSFLDGNTTCGAFSSKQVDLIISNIKNKRQNLGFIDVDTSTDIASIKAYTQDVWNEYDAVVVLGIGGSALGTKALLEALYGKYYNENQKKNGKNIYVLDNIDSDSIADLESVIDIKRTLFCFISKSGSTIETLSEYLYFRKKCSQLNPNWQKQFCFIVGENCSMREKLEEDFQVFYIPENIGGRFSVFTPVGLLPLAFSGLDIGEFISGVRAMKELFLSSDIEKNIALKLAALQYHYYTQENKNITVFFPYSSRMFWVGEWYKQLMGESIGKDGKGITLTSSLGVTDQHSQLQLFQDGPRDKFFITLGINSPKKDYQILENTDDMSFDALLQIERYGTETSLKNEGVPLCSIMLESLSEQSVAALLYMYMFQIAYLGELFEINAFDQPGVEKSKIITKQKLKEEFGEIDMFKKAFYE